MTLASLALLAAAGSITGFGDPAPILGMGGDPSRGLLVNHNPGARPSDPPDAARPTLVFIHGYNPMPRTVHFTMADRLAEALARRGGPALNLLSWEWNAATSESLHPRTNVENAVVQG